MYDFQWFHFEKMYHDLSEIYLEDELKKQYDGYPTAVVVAFMRSGSETVFDMKKLISVAEKNKQKIRNVGAVRLETAKKLIKKYETEALI